MSGAPSTPLLATRAFAVVRHAAAQRKAHLTRALAGFYLALFNSNEFACVR